MGCRMPSKHGQQGAKRLRREGEPSSITTIEDGDRVMVCSLVADSYTMLEILRNLQRGTD